MELESENLRESQKNYALAWDLVCDIRRYAGRYTGRYVGCYEGRYSGRYEERYEASAGALPGCYALNFAGRYEGRHKTRAFRTRPFRRTELRNSDSDLRNRDFQTP
jgi:hypothetical protein